MHIYIKRTFNFIAMNMARKRQPKTEVRGVGRPRGAAEPERIRRQLLDATAQILTEQGYRRSSVRLIAERAGVNPALINYYFGSKQGLVLELVRKVIGPVMQQFQHVAQNPELSGRATLHQFLQQYTHAILEAPWLPQLVMQEVFEDEGKLREPFIEEFASRVGGDLRAQLERDQARGELSARLDPNLAALGVMSLALFPFVARGAAEHVFQLKVDRKFVDRLVDQTVDLLYGEAGTPEKRTD
ncbi:MAG: TetR/AcrR family transcriptional regulator [Gammaproteobacteria bacterium]